MAINIRKFFEGIGLVPKASLSLNSKGELQVLDSNGKLNYHNGTTASPVVTEAHAATLTNKTIDSDVNTLSIDIADLKDITADKILRSNSLGAIVEGNNLPNNSAIVTVDATQTLAFKTLNSPIINTPIITNPTGLTKSNVGLGNVDNVADLDKPVSNATQTALDLKVDKAGDIMTGPLTLSGNPTNNLHAATKQYVDSSIPTSANQSLSNLTSPTSVNQNLAPANTQTLGTTTNPWTLSILNNVTAAVNSTLTLRTANTASAAPELILETGTGSGNSGNIRLRPGGISNRGSVVVENRLNVPLIEGLGSSAAGFTDASVAGRAVSYEALLGGFAAATVNFPTANPTNVTVMFPLQGNFFGYYLIECFIARSNLANNWDYQIIRVGAYQNQQTNQWTLIPAVTLLASTQGTPATFSVSNSPGSEGALLVSIPTMPGTYASGFLKFGHGTRLYQI